MMKGTTTEPLANLDDGTGDHRAAEADSHVLDALQRMRLPCTFSTRTLATPQMAAHRISHALARLVRRQVIVAESHRALQITRWTVSAINPPSSWRRQ